MSLLGPLHIVHIQGKSLKFLSIQMEYLVLQTAAERGGYGGERYEKLEFQKKVEQKFKALKDSTWQVQKIFQLYSKQ